MPKVGQWVALRAAQLEVLHSLLVWDWRLVLAAVVDVN